MVDTHKFTWQHAVVDSDLDSTTKHFLLTLSIHMDMTGQSCFPSVSVIAEKMGVARRTVFRCISKAEEAGFIKKGKHGFSGQRSGQNEYVASWPELRGDTESGVTQSHQRGDTESPQGVTQSHLYKNRSKEQIKEQTNKKNIQKKESKILLPSYESKHGRVVELDSFIKWADQNQLDIKKLTEAYDGVFRDWALSNAKRYADWRATFCNYLRNVSWSGGLKAYKRKIDRSDHDAVLAEWGV